MPLPLDQKITLLKDARVYLTTVLGTLDRRTETCSCCNRDKCLNWPEAKAADEIEGMINKLDKLVGKLANQQPQPPKGWVVWATSTDTMHRATKIGPFAALEEARAWIRTASNLYTYEVKPEPY